jgi:hypothetical protein
VAGYTVEVGRDPGDHHTISTISRLPIMTWNVSLSPIKPGNSKLLASGLTKEQACAYRDQLLADGWKSNFYTLTVWSRRAS